jgi:hypothetical protein
MRAKIAFVPKQVAESATRNTPIKRSICELSNLQPPGWRLNIIFVHFMAKGQKPSAKFFTLLNYY